MNGEPDIRRVELSSPDLVPFLESIWFGGRGLRYRRVNLGKTFAALDNAYALTVQERGTLRGAYVLGESTARLGQESIRSVYRGLLAVDPLHTGKGLGKRLVSAALREINRNGDPAFTWGLIEADNLASRRLLARAGADDAGALISRLVYRQMPRSSENFVRLDTPMASDYSARLGNEQSALSLGRVSARPAYGLVRDGQLVAAARCGETTLDLGAGGPVARFFHRYAYSRIEALGRRYNRRALRYLSIHEPLVTPDAADAWPEFLSALLAHHSAHMALFVLDPESTTERQFEKVGLFGTLARQTRTELRLVTTGMPARWLQHAGPIRGGPLF